MILANYTQENRNTTRVRGLAYTNPLAQWRPTLLPNFFVASDPTVGRDLASLPHGYNTHGAWMLPLKAGGMASTLNLTGEGDAACAALAVKLAEAALSGDGSLAAIGSLIVQAIAALTGAGAMTDADLKAFLQAVADITGSSSMSGTMTGLAELIAALVGDGTSGGSTVSGVGELDADLTVTGTGLSTANVGQAVWAALAVANNAPGTMGEKMNDAGSASNPWTEVIESGFTAAEILKLIAAVIQGDATGLESGAPVFKGLDGTTDRVTGVYSAGTRVITDRDAT